MPCGPRLAADDSDSQRGSRDLFRGSLDESWGQFMANGAREPVQAVIAALPLIETGDDVEQMLIGGAARWSLRSQALQHPFVLAYCQDAARGADEPNRHLLRALIDDVRRDFNAAEAP